MRRFETAFLSGLLVLGILSQWPAVAQTAPPGQADIEALKKTAVKVYLDCGSCDIEYIKNEITFVNYVRDRNEAHVHILITTLATGSGGNLELQIDPRAFVRAGSQTQLGLDSDDPQAIDDVGRVGVAIDTASTRPRSSRQSAKALTPSSAAISCRSACRYWYSAIPRSCRRSRAAAFSPRPSRTPC